MAHVAKAETYDAECLYHGVVAAEVGNERLVVVGILHAGHLAKHRYGGCIFNVLAAMYGYIEHIAEPQYEGRYAESDNKAHEQNDKAAGADLLIAYGSLNQSHIGLVDGLLQGYLLTLVEQIGVECLLERLLALYVEALLLLFGSTGHAACEHVFVGTCSLQAHFERIDITAQRRGYGLTHLCKLAVHFAHHGLVFA